jgi:hypothetical protein
LGRLSIHPDLGDSLTTGGKELQEPGVIVDVLSSQREDIDSLRKLFPTSISYINILSQLDQRNITEENFD